MSKTNYTNTKLLGILLLLSTVSFIGVILGSNFKKESLKKSVESASKPVIAKQKTYDIYVHQVALLDDRAEPDTLIAKVNEYIQFNSQDEKSHNITLGEGNRYSEDHDHIGIVESGIFNSDEGYRVQLKKPGTYNFHDHTNPNIFITIIAYTDSLESN